MSEVEVEVEEQVRPKFILPEEPKKEAQEEEVQEEVVQEEEATGDVTVSLGEAETEEEQHAPSWVKDLRKQNREMARDLREARRKLNEAGAEKVAELKPKPTLEEYAYDAEKYETALTGWLEEKKRIDAVQEAKNAEAKAADQRWQGKLATYGTAKTMLGIKDFDEVEAVALDLLDTIQQGIIVSGAKDAALLMYALGKSEAKLKELATIKDPVEFAFAVARLEGQVKVTGKKPVTQPEGRVSGDSRPSGTVDSTLDRLRAEAARTGDYTKVTEYKRKKRA